MDAEFVARGTGWRGRGRPPKPIPGPLMTMLEQTSVDGTQAQIPRDGATERDVAELKRTLERGADTLGMRLRFQADDDTIRFYVEDPQAGAGDD
jgi:hypothetical protein